MSQVALDPYLFFPGNCREAMTFYQSVFGGNVVFSDNEDGTVMHADLKDGEVSLMASDSSRREPYPMSFISLSLAGTDTEKLTGFFNKLAEGGKIESPLKVESWGDTFGTLTDKYGIDWMVNIGTH